MRRLLPSLRLALVLCLGLGLAGQAGSAPDRAEAAFDALLLSGLPLADICNGEEQHEHCADCLPGALASLPAEADSLPSSGTSRPEPAPGRLSQTGRPAVHALPRGPPVPV